jgi:hypothetical protein
MPLRGVWSPASLCRIEIPEKRGLRAMLEIAYGKLVSAEFNPHSIHSMDREEISVIVG